MKLSKIPHKVAPHKASSTFARTKCLTWTHLAKMTLNRCITANNGIKRENSTRHSDVHHAVNTAILQCVRRKRKHTTSKLITKQPFIFEANFNSGKKKNKKEVKIQLIKRIQWTVTRRGFNLAKTKPSQIKKNTNKYAITSYYLCTIVLLLQGTHRIAKRQQRTKGSHQVIS